MEMQMEMEMEMEMEMAEVDIWSAAKNGNEGLLRQLILRVVNLNQYQDGETPLCCAASHGQVKCVKLLIEGAADFNLACRNGSTPLNRAASEGHVDCVKLLVESGANVDLADLEGCSPLSCAAFKGHVDCVKLLLESGANVDLAEGCSPLSCAAFEGHVDCVKLLLKGETNDRGTALNAAAFKGHVDCVKLLLEDGTNVNVDMDGCTPLYWAASEGHVNCVKVLLKAGARTDSADRDGRTPVNWAASKGHLDCVKLLLACCANVNLSDKDGCSPLNRAASDGHWNCVKLLLRGGANVDLADTNGSTPIIKAASLGYEDSFKLLLEGGANVNVADKDGWTPLHGAASRDHVDCVKLLLEGGANVNVADKDGWTPLHGAASRDHVDCVKLLLEGGANVNVADKNEWTPLLLAALRSQVECVKLFLEAGASTNRANKDGRTPLFEASIRGHVDCMKLLLEAGASVDLADNDGGTPLFEASFRGHEDSAKLLLEAGAFADLADNYGCTPLSFAADYCRVDLMKLLLEAGASVDLAYKDGNTPLCKAVYNGREDCVKLLLEAGASTNRANKDGRTPLFEAIIRGRVDCVKLLLEAGASVDLADKDGRTPLLLAVSKGHYVCMKLLVEGGANVDLADVDGRTPLDWATLLGHVNCVKLLLQNGTNASSVHEGTTPLFLAASKGHVDCLKLLLEAGDSADLTEVDGTTPLFLAASKGHVNCIVELIAHEAKLSYRASTNPCATLNFKGRTALHVAVETNRAKKVVFNIILAYPKAVDIRDNDGKTPLDIAFQSGSDAVIWLLFQHQKDVSYLKEASPLLYAATRMTRRTIQSVHIHLIGHGYAGKTTCRLALNKTLKHLNPMKFGLFGDHKNVSVDRSCGSGRTEGMEMDSIESPHHKWLIRDYGGQEDFHVNHARFLSVPGSIYVIVVALWDAEKHCRFNMNEIKTRFMYWLKFLNSIAEEGTTMHCITVINVGEKVGKQSTDSGVTAIKDCCAVWKLTHSSVMVHGDPCVLSVCKVTEVRKLNSFLQLAADNSKHEHSIPVLNYIDAIEFSFRDNVRNLESRMDRRSNFVKSVCLPAVCALLGVEGPLSSEIKYVEHVCEKMIEYLCASGKIIVVPTSTSPDDPLIVLDVNWLSKELLGSLINKLSESGREEFVLTASEIDNFTNSGSGYFGGLDGLVSFLESIGACVAIPAVDATNDIRRWFPLCGQKKFVVGEDCIAMEKGVWNTFRKVVRLFKLSDPVHQMFPPGYFIDLFLKILSAYSMDSAKTVKVFINGMEVKYQFSDTRMQLLLVVLDDKCSFTLEVSYASEISTSVSFSKDECWKRFIEICEIIMNPKEVYAAKDIIRVNPWFDNVKLTEMFVDPTNEALVNAQKILKQSSEVKEVRNTKSLADLTGRNEALRNLYILGCTESDMPVSDKATPRHILERIEARLEKLQKHLEERWNTVTVTVSSDLIQESFNVMMNSLQNSASTELHAMVEASRQAICQDALTESRLKSVIDELRNDISQKITSENAQVLIELDQAQKSMKELRDEVHNIQNLNDKALQTAILKAFDESKALLRIDNMIQTVLKGTSDVPTMVIVIPVVKKGFPFNPSDWTSNEYSLYFVCSHSHQVVACGPDSKGFRFRRAKEWFKKVAPVLKVCLIAAKIALTISGIPIPINGVVESLDQITAVAETTKYLKNALSVVDATSDAADTLGVAVGDQGTGVTDKSVDNAEQYVKSLDDLLKQSDTIEAYKQLKALLDEVDPNLSSVGVEKVTSESGKTGWVKKGDQAVKDSFKKDKMWPMKIEALKESYNDAVAASAPDVQSKLGSRLGLWLPKSLRGNKKN